jgi:hypothetical protein
MIFHTYPITLIYMRIIIILVQFHLQIGWNFIHISKVVSEYTFLPFCFFTAKQLVSHFAIFWHLYCYWSPNLGLKKNEQTQQPFVVRPNRYFICFLGTNPKASDQFQLKGGYPFLWNEDTTKRDVDHGRKKITLNKQFKENSNLWRD